MKETSKLIIKIPGCQVCARCLGQSTQTDAGIHKTSHTVRGRRASSYRAFVVTFAILGHVPHISKGVNKDRIVSKKQDSNSREMRLQDGSEGKSNDDRRLCREPGQLYKGEWKSWPGISKKLMEIIHYLISLTPWKIVVASYWIVWEGSAIKVKRVKQIKKGI